MRAIGEPQGASPHRSESIAEIARRNDVGRLGAGAAFNARLDAT